MMDLEYVRKCLAEVSVAFRQLQEPDKAGSIDNEEIFKACLWKLEGAFYSFYSLEVRRKSVGHWIPIEYAPKDGSFFIAGRAGCDEIFYDCYRLGDELRCYGGEQNPSQATHFFIPIPPK